MSNSVNVFSTVYINGFPIEISEQPVYKTGVSKKERKTCLGAGRVSTYVIHDYEDAKSMVELKVPNLQKYLEFFESIYDKIDNEIMLVDEGHKISVKFNNMSITEEPELDFTSESFEITFEGDPVR